MKIRLTKCWLVEVTDDNGKEITYDFSFGNKEDAKKLGEKLKVEMENHTATKS